MSKTKKQSKKLSNRIDWMYLAEFLKIRTPSSGEQLSQHCLLDYVTQMGYTPVVDPFGNVIVYVNEQIEKRFTLLIDAHFDEIGFSVIDINPEGYLHFVPVGGADIDVSAGIYVWIHTKNGLVKGVIGNKSIHLKDDDEPKQTWNKLFIDIGCSSRQEAEQIVSRGDLITTVEESHWIGNSRLSGRALDNHIGCFAILQLLYLLQNEKNKLDCNVCVSFTTQEETELGGGKHMANKIKPDLAIVVDIDAATDHPYVDKYNVSNLSLGNGVVLSKDLKTNTKIHECIANLAKQKHIPFQSLTHSPGDTNFSMMYNHAIPGIIMGVCARYLHSSITTIDIFDLQHLIFLLHHIIHHVNNLQHLITPYYQKLSEKKKKYTKKCVIPKKDVSVTEGLSKLLK